jgi:hypothetical protein
VGNFHILLMSAGVIIVKTFFTRDHFGTRLRLFSPSFYFGSHMG